MDFAKIAETLAGIGLPMLARILGGAVGGPLGAAAAGALVSKITSALGLPDGAGANDISAAITSDPTAAASKLSVLEQKAATDLAFSAQQIKVDLAEAASPSLFIAGWRPAFAWSIVAWTNITLGVGLTFVLLGKPLNGLANFLILLQVPWGLFAGMVGIRSAEKWGRVATARIRRWRGF